jgi:hypothetical protein
VRLPVLQQDTGNPHRLSQIYIKVDDPAHLQNVVQELRELLPGYPIYIMEDFTSMLSIDSIGLLRNFIGVVIAIAIIVGFIVVSMAMYTVALERTREIGILRSLGASSAMILGLPLKETLLLSVAGTVVGVALTYFASARSNTSDTPVWCRKRVWLVADCWFNRHCRSRFGHTGPRIQSHPPGSHCGASLRITTQDESGRGLCSPAVQLLSTKARGLVRHGR